MNKNKVSNKYIADNVYPMLVNTNKENLKDEYFVPVTDELATILIVDMHDDEENFGVITKDIMEKLDESYIFDCAMNNNMKNPIYLNPIQDMLELDNKENCQDLDEPSAYFFVSESGFATSALFLPVMLEAFYKQFGDFAFIPICTDQSIVIPVEKYENVDFLDDIAENIDNFISSDDILSNSIYIFEGENLLRLT